MAPDAIAVLAVGAAIVGTATLTAVRAHRALERARADWRRRLAGSDTGVLATVRQAHLHYLQARGLTTPGRAGELYRQRATLARTVSAALATVSEARAAGAPVGELPRLADEVAALAAREERALRLLANAGDGVVQLSRVRELVTLADSVRAAAEQALHGVTEPELRRLAGELERERSAIADGLARWRTVIAP